MIENLSFSQIVATKICHDLASPIGAISNGLEMLEMDMDDQDSMKFLMENAKALVSELKFYRFMLGKVEANVPLKKLTELFIDYLVNTKTNFQLINETAQHDMLLPCGFAQLLSMMIYIAKQIGYSASRISLILKEAQNQVVVKFEIEAKRIIVNEHTKQLLQDRNILSYNNENIIYFMAFELAKNLKIDLDFSYMDQNAFIELKLEKWTI